MNNFRIELITYEKDRHDFFVNAIHRAKKKYDRLSKKYKDEPYLSEGAERLSDAGRELQFYRDVIEMLENGCQVQRTGEWVHSHKAQHWRGKDECSECHYHDKDRKDLSNLNFCPNCGAKMKGGTSDGCSKG